MPDFVSRKKLKKKVLDRWENEGGTLSANNQKTRVEEPKRKRKLRKTKRSQSSAVGST